MSLNHKLMVLHFTQTYLWFLSILVVYDPYLVLIDLIAICTYLLLRCLLSDRYDNLFSKVIMTFLLISRMHIYILLLLSISFTFYILFGNTNLVSERFCHLGWLWPQRYSLYLLNPYCFFAYAVVFMFLCI